MDLEEITFSKELIKKKKMESQKSHKPSTDDFWELLGKSISIESAILLVFFSFVKINQFVRLRT